MIPDALYSIKHWSKERLSNPFLRAYIGFLLLFNWRIPVIVFFGDGSIRERMELIRTYSHPSWVAYLVPLTLAVAYVLGMPKLSWWLQKWQSKPINDEKLARMQADLDLAEKRKQIAQADVDRNNARETATLKLKERESEIENRRLTIQNRHEIEKLEVQERSGSQVLNADNRHLQSRVTELQNQLRDLELRHSHDNKELIQERDNALRQLNEKRSDEARKSERARELERQVQKLEGKVEGLEGQLRTAEANAQRAEMALQFERTARGTGAV